MELRRLMGVFGQFEGFTGLRICSISIVNGFTARNAGRVLFQKTNLADFIHNS
ncbi:hypothetical protein NXW11_00600 [Bacteroides thetaiotaomicron]|uniref:hypothetical protein n=1 Tax=Bacteroides thetaiotaomicron TaxID=818 RepID=UPI0021669AAA|nr:hypothetical protein [Bacteroides thetaiotaomicron]MCS2616475.1 hypothetical protein [Bacteroides thetaiotaomicron]